MLSYCCTVPEGLLSTSTRSGSHCSNEHTVPLARYTESAPQILFQSQTVILVMQQISTKKVRLNN